MKYYLEDLLREAIQEEKFFTELYGRCTPYPMRDAVLSNVYTIHEIYIEKIYIRLRNGMYYKLSESLVEFVVYEILS